MEFTPGPSSVFQKQKFRFSSTKKNVWSRNQRDEKITAYNTAHAVKKFCSIICQRSTKFLNPNCAFVY